MQQQTNLINRLKNNLPNNLLLVGQKYSGKKTLVKEITDDFYWVESNVETIRSLDKGDYVFADIDDWSNACYSAMLNLLEFNENHIIITCKNIMNLPMSIQSRCVIEKMEPYTNIGFFCDNIGQLEYYSEEMLKSIDELQYDEKYDLDVYFTVLCNRLLHRIKNGEDLTKEFLISCKYNAVKNLKSLNKKQFILNWQFDLKGYTNEWKRL